MNTDPATFTDRSQQSPTLVHRSLWLDAAVLSGLIVIGTLLRVTLDSIPNFAPVAAIALFAGFYFRRAAVALIAPLSIMLLSDWWLQHGGYAWQINLAVYGSLSAPILLRRIVRALHRSGRSRFLAHLRRWLGLLCCALGSSVLFFATTNLIVWLHWYPVNLAGLAQCYLAALAFFHWTVLGDLFFTLALFAAYSLAVQLGWLRHVYPLDARQPAASVS